MAVPKGENVEKPFNPKVVARMKQKGIKKWERKPTNGPKTVTKLKETKSGESRIVKRRVVVDPETGKKVIKKRVYNESGALLKRTVKPKPVMKRIPAQ